MIVGNVPRFDRFDRGYKRLFQDASTYSPEHEAEQSSFEILALAYDDEVNVGCAVGVTREVVGVAGSASPHIRVSRCKDDVV